MMDKQLESMAQKAAAFVPPSKRNAITDKIKRNPGAPATVGVEAGTEATTVKAPGKPEMTKAKEYIKPMVSNRPMGGPLNRGAMGRMLGRV